MCVTRQCLAAAQAHLYVHVRGVPRVGEPPHVFPHDVGEVLLGLGRRVDVAEERVVHGAVSQYERTEEGWMDFLVRTRDHLCSPFPILLTTLYRVTQHV